MFRPKGQLSYKSACFGDEVLAPRHLTQADGEAFRVRVACLDGPVQVLTIILGFVPQRLLFEDRDVIGISWKYRDIVEIS